VLAVVDATDDERIFMCATDPGPPPKTSDEREVTPVTSTMLRVWTV